MACMHRVRETWLNEMFYFFISSFVRGDYMIVKSQILSLGFMSRSFKQTWTLTISSWLEDDIKQCVSSIFIIGARFNNVQICDNHDHTLGESLVILPSSKDHWFAGLNPSLSVWSLHELLMYVWFFSVTKKVKWVKDERNVTTNYSSCVN